METKEAIAKAEGKQCSHAKIEDLGPPPETARPAPARRMVDHQRTDDGNRERCPGDRSFRSLRSNGFDGGIPPS